MKCWQNPEFEQVLLDKEEVIKDPWHSAIIFGIFLERQKEASPYFFIKLIPSSKQL
jgi:hypothetical protein